MTNEPSMEEILSSIKRIIAEEDGVSATSRASRRPVAASSSAERSMADDQILELTDAVADEVEEAPAAVLEEPKPAPTKAERAAEAKAQKAEKAPARTRPAATPAPQPSDDAAETLVSDDSARAARDSLVNLSRLLISPDDSQPNTLDGLVREMLRPMLKEWLDTNLPPLVETMVKREIDRITGRL